MKRIGLIGGMSWHSTATYYRLVNERVAVARGGHASAEVSLQSVDFARVRQCQIDGDWAGSARLLAEAARRCEAGGAEVMGLCTNLMHKNFDVMAEAVGVPCLHIADAVADAAQRNGWSTLGILGTSWVMTEPFYADRLAARGICAAVPDAGDRDLIDRVIFDELTRGVVTDASRADYQRIIDDLGTAGADAVVLACTEIGLLVTPESSSLPVIDSAVAHAEALAELALG